MILSVLKKFPLVVVRTLLTDATFLGGINARVHLECPCDTLGLPVLTASLAKTQGHTC